mgnify:CR=1 FL=1
MRLLQPKEREISYKKERDFTKKQASELAEEATNLVKGFNRTKVGVERNEKLLLADYNEFRSELGEKRRTLEEEVRLLEQSRDNAFVLLYKKEEELKKIEVNLNNLEGELIVREDKIKSEETKVKEIKLSSEIALETANKKEKDVFQREIALEEKTKKFNNFRANQERLFNRDEQKLRDWLETERIKLRK